MFFTINFVIQKQVLGPRVLLIEHFRNCSYQRRRVETSSSSNSLQQRPHGSLQLT
jgi:hypothetical protein